MGIARIRCALSGHVWMRHVSPERLALRCTRCGNQSSGWALPITTRANMTTTTETDPQTAIAKPASAPLRVAMGGVIPNGLDEAWRLAKMVSESTIVPKDFQGKPANVLIAIEAGWEVGLPWMQAVQGSAIINGRHGFFGDTFLAILVASPVFVDHDEYFLVRDGKRVEALTPEDLKDDATTAVCVFTRKGRTRPIVRTFSIGQARTAGLLGKEGPWRTYPDRQLRMRARAFAGRDAFPDVLKGMGAAEELHDTPAAEIEPEPIAEPVAPRRASTASVTADNDARAEERERAHASSSGRAHAADPDPSGNAITPPAAPAAAEAPAPIITPRFLEARGPITHTAYSTPRGKGGWPYYEVTIRTADGVARTFRTRDETHYREAASFEGTPHAVVITYTINSAAEDPTKTVDVIKTLAIEDERTPPAAPPESEPTLFS